MPREYEFGIVYDLGSHDENGLEAVTEKFVRVMEDVGGDVVSIKYLGRQRLALPISKVINGDYVVGGVEIDDYRLTDAITYLKRDSDIVTVQVREGFESSDRPMDSLKWQEFREVSQFAVGSSIENVARAFERVFEFDVSALVKRVREAMAEQQEKERKDKDRKKREREHIDDDDLPPPLKKRQRIVGYSQLLIGGGDTEFAGGDPDDGD